MRNQDPCFSIDPVECHLERSYQPSERRTSGVTKGLLRGMSMLLLFAATTAQSVAAEPQALSPGASQTAPQSSLLYPRQALQTPGIGSQVISSPIQNTAANVVAPQGGPGDNYVLSYNDLISVRVYNEPDMDSTVRIARDGSVNLPLVGTVKIGGLSLQQATKHVRELLAKDYLVNPQLNLTIVEFSRRQFTILGEVQRPGPYVFPDDRPLTLQQAIALAGGYTPGAKTRVTITRFIGNEKEILRVDAGALNKDRDSKPFIILPDDHITVHERFF